ncbi:MBL fold metallo-hydrolase, partial [SCandidatus Aminicenantes bacterium Aminicenantia_JdfR_composite]|nr:MBL fold metallo-hydrolase [SCandidatus Aminicenantes bacterium Aminicenantia_JdfR_composite]
MKRRTFLNSILVGGLMVTKPGIFLSNNKKVSQKNETNALVKVIGTAQDGGIPHAGCYCTNCIKARKNKLYSRLISSLALIDFSENKTFLIDATPDIRKQLDILHNRIKSKKKRFHPDGIFLTHAHIGHYTGLMFFGFEALSTSQLPVYCSSQMHDFLINNGPWNLLVKLNNIKIYILEPEKEFNVSKNISIIPFVVPHRAEYTDTLGFIICGKKRKLLYIPDIQSWEAWKKPINKIIEEVDFALIDGTFFSSDELPHRDLSKIGHPFILSSIKLLANIAKKTKIYFTHLNHSNLSLNPEGKEIEKI